MANDGQKVNQFQEALLGSFETYYNEMVKRNQYDVTVDATIVDVSQKPDGIYRVKTTGAEFEAYATAGSYYKNDIVLVQIPNGDYKNPKFILGRKADVEANKTFAFKLPFDDFIGLQDLQGDVNSQTSGAYWANWPETSQGQYDLLNNLVWCWQGDEDSTVGNTRIGIEANWQTFLGSYFPIRGSYGFRIIVNGTTAATELTAATNIEREYYFTNVDMYGNPYAYQTPFSQQKVLDVSEFLKINKINVYFYQDFNFADNLNAYILYEDKDATRPFVPQNILFSGLKIYLGVSAENLTDETTFLYSHQSLSYNSKEETIYDEALGMKQTIFSCDEKKKALFTWVHYESDGTFSVIKDNTDLTMQRDKAGKKTHVFWYRYDYDATDAEMIWDIKKYPTHQALKDDWTDSVGDPVTGKEPNPNYECPMERYAGPHWEFLPNYTDKFEVEFTPRGNKSREKFKVVVQHDGTHTTSKELVFKNSRDIEAELLAGAKNDAAILKTYRIAKVNGTYEAIEDGSINAFHVYDENNKILVNDDGDRFDHHYYYMQIHVRDEEDNLYRIIETVSGANTPVSTGTSIAWAFPRSYTMIASTEEVTLDDAKYFDIEQNPDSVEFQNFHNATIKFKIGSTYNNRYLDNTVGAIINQNGKTYHIEKDLMFGRAEGLGHEFLPVIEIVNPVGGTYLHCGDPNEFAIACAVYNKDGSLFEKPELLTFTWRELSQQCNFYHIDVVDGQEQRYDTYKLSAYKDLGKPEDLESSYTEKYKGYRGNVVSGSIIIPEDGFVKPPIFEVTVNGAASYPLTVRKGFMICNDAKHKQTRDIFVPSRVEFKSDGADPIFYANYFEVAQLISNPNASYAEYNIEHPEWKINEQDTLSLRKTTTPREFIEHDDNGDIVVSDQGYDKYQLIFNGGEKAKPQWTNSYLDPERYTYIYYNYINDEGLNIYLAQSIAFDRNYYASSLVNNWDGTSLTWDEDNGAILSTMIAAGSKDANNRFTGVMMGDWHAKGDESLDVPGMYGYNNGEQTFGFKTDGTGFIGGSGRGRIEFDGREAVISNANRSCYINLNPVNVSLDYNALNNQSFSQNFIYCRVPKSQNEFDSLSDSIAGKASWAKKYFEDKDNDYFVVDPNYGVLTTGGIVAKYGALGNWMISDQGMYQKKNTQALDELGHYMYLGFDETDTMYARKWTEKKTNLLQARKNCENLFTELDKQNNEKTASENLKNEKEANKSEKIEVLQTQINKLNQDIETATTEYDRINNEILSLDAEIDTIENDTIPGLWSQQQTNIALIDTIQKEIDNYELLIEGQREIIASSNDANAKELIAVQNQIDTLDNIRENHENYKILINEYENTYNQLIIDKNTYTDLLQKLDIETPYIEYNNAEQAVTQAAEELELLKTTNNNIKDNVLVLEEEITALLQTIEVDDEITDAATYQQIIDNLAEVIDNCNSIINNNQSTAEEIADANSQKENAVQQKEVYEAILLIAKDRDPLVAEMAQQQSVIDEKQQNLDEVLIPAQLQASEAYEACLQKQKTYNDKLNETEVKIAQTKDNVNRLSALFQNVYDDLVMLLERLGDNINITLTQDILSTDDLYREGEPNAYPINTNNETDINIYIQFELTLNKKRYDYLVYKIGNGYNDNVLGQIRGSVENTLYSREEQLSQELNQNPVILGAQTLIADYQSKIDSLDKQINNPYYQDNNEEPGLKQQNALIQQEVAELLVQISNKKQERERLQLLLEPQQDIIITNTNLIGGLQNDITNIINEIVILENYIETIDNNIGKIMAEIVNNKNLINDIQENTYEEIVKNNLMVDFQITMLHSDSSLSDIIEVANIVIAVINEIITNKSIRYAIYISQAEPMLDAQQVMPYFSVDWAGNLFARKGKIANTWNIDDYSLTYQKNNDILYLGSEEYLSNNMKTEGNAYIPKGRALKPGQLKLYTKAEEEQAKTEGRTDIVNDNTCWAISASNYYYPHDEEKNPDGLYPINFGVTLSGKLYAQLGTIGGWNITNSTLESPLFDIDKKGNMNSIIFDALNGRIEFSNGSFVVDGAKGEVKLGLKYNDGVGIGTVYLSDYLLSGRTRTDTLATGALASSKTDSSTNQTIGSYDRGNGWGGSSSGSLSVAVSTSTWLFKTDYKILDPNFFQIIDKTQSLTDVGVVLATGPKAAKSDSSKDYTNTDESAILFYPTINGATLGTTSLKWNLIAETISASLIDAGGINGKKVYMDKDLVVTEKVMYNALNKLWNALDSTDSSASSAGRAARAAMDKAQKALDELERLTQTIIADLNELNAVLKRHRHDFSGSGTDNISISGDRHRHNVTMNGVTKGTSYTTAGGGSATVSITISGTTKSSGEGAW